MKLGIFGGTFNPPHNAHIKIAEEAEKQFALDRILFIPTHLPPHKVEPDLAPPSHRLAMVKMILKGRPKWTCSDMEILRPGPSYTLDTLNELRKQHPSDELFLIIGSDNLLTFHLWHEAKKVNELATILVYERPTFPLPLDSKELEQHLNLKLNYHVIRGKDLDIASSIIRTILGQKKILSGLVPADVLAYIKTHHLYQDQEA